MTTNARISDQVSERELRHQALAYEAATEGIVLLSNNGTLPIAPCAVALYGAGAGYTLSGGSGSGEVNVRHVVTVQEGLTAAGFTILTTDWIERYDRLWRAGKQAFLRRMRLRLMLPTTRVLTSLMASSYHYPAGDRLSEEEIRATATDTCIYVIARQAGEGHDCTDTPGSHRLDETEILNIRLCAEHYRRLVVVINSGNPIDLSPIADLPGIDAIVYMGQAGQEGGRALAAVLTGEVSPSGRLAVSWPMHYSDVPFAREYDSDPHHAEYKEGQYVGYRYYDSFAVEPRYPFGYGLSFTTFAITPASAAIEGDTVSCTLRVTNSGTCYAGRQVVQLYARCPGEDRPSRQLVAFGKTPTLQPGQEEQLTLTFSMHDLAMYDTQRSQTILPAGVYLLEAGSSSRDTQPIAAVRVDTTIVLIQHKPLCKAATRIAVLTHSNSFVVPQDLPELLYHPERHEPRVIDYTLHDEPLPDEVSRLVSSMSDDELLTFCSGTGMSGEKQGFRTPGAVGHTTAAFIDRGVPNVELCDGPAGLRIERRAVQYPGGEIRAVDMSLSVYEFFPRLLLRLFVLGDPEKGQLLYQFVTGFPTEALVAQTWDTTLAERIGRAVGIEMQEYGVTFWLAPAMNIVRNPLCGRNYEYLSEDPLLTGRLAAAITRGAQQTPGVSATLKHFSANNQENDRYTISSDVDEDVLRMIYWRGFELAIRESEPRALMTAYNRLNGTYCANNRELCTDLLRCEWQFRGVVMTDWMSTGKDRADEAQAISVGVDTLMPGGKKEQQALRRAYADGRLTSTAIRRAAARMLRAILRI